MEAGWEVTPRAKDPTSRAGILAAGLIRIVRTPAELDAAGEWWCAEKPGLYPDDVKRARSEGMKAGLPHWLAKPVTPRDAVARMFRDAESGRRAACQYLDGKTYTPPSHMSPTQLRAALGTQHRRLSGGWGDTGKGLDVEVTPLDDATIEMLPVAASPEPVAAERAAVPTLPHVSTAPARLISPGKRDRLAWVPVMQRLAAMYARGSQGGHQ
jgi:hypothetical protein